MPAKRATALIAVTLLASAAHAAPPPYWVRVEASPTQTLTHTYFVMGTPITADSPDPQVGHYGGLVEQIVPIGSLPAATPESPDVLTISVPALTVPYRGGRILSPPLGGYVSEGQIVSRYGGSWSIVGLYAPGHVTVTDRNGVGASFESAFPGYRSTSEETLADALVNGDLPEIHRFWQVGMWLESTILGNDTKFINFSTGTFGGTVTAVLTTPEPSSVVGVGAAGLFAVLRRRKRQRA